MITITFAFTLIDGLVCLVAVPVFGWALYRWLQRSESTPGWLVAQWGLTVLVIGILVVAMSYLFRQDPYVAAFMGGPLLAACGVGLAAIWRTNITSFIAKPFVNLYTGENQPSDPTALYSIAEAKRKRGRYQEAAQEIEAQLIQFPTDFKGHLLLAEIQAENLRDVPAAQATLERLLAQADHAPKNIAFALNRLADWQLNLSHQIEAARQSLDQIIQLFPETELAYHASQRIAHLNLQRVREREETRHIILKKGEENIGLRPDFEGLKPPPENIEAVVDGYIQQLERFPADNEAREQLALIYAHHYHRLDLAVEQLEQLIAQPGVPVRLVVRWLNLMVDLHIAVAADSAAARQTLTRITQLFPNSPDAEKALSRLQFLVMEIKGQQKGRSVQLGTYDNPYRLK